jgi:chemosensory pili system protein ChpA (sensor histidine kinase/response regulator)
MADSGFRHELDINTLSWVKTEIDTTLEQAHKALEAYEESPEDDSQIKFCLNYLHQVHGTLKMVELYGASLVAEELENLTLALSQNKVSNKEETFQVLIKGMVQLPDYLENLLSGQKDIPVVLLPLLNDMRAARGENLLTENALFSPDMDVAIPASESGLNNAGDIQSLAKKLRHSYHLGLLHWFTEKNVSGGIKQVSRVVNQLRDAANDSEVNKLLWIASGVLEGLREGGLESSIAVKLLAGNVDREIKKIIDNGEVDYLKEPPKELIKNLLYYVSCSSTNGDAVKEIKQAFKLQDIMPNTKTLEKARADLAGPNAALMQTVSTVLMDELTQVKDNLDVFVRSDTKDIGQLTPLSTALSQMSDTLGMLGLGIQRATIREQKQRLDAMISGEEEINETVLMDVAGSLLSVENSLNDLGQIKGNKFNNDTVEQTLQNAEKQKLLKSVISEAKVDLSNVKESLSAFSRDPSNHELLADIPTSLSQIQGSLSILNLTRASNLLEECNEFIKKDLIAEQSVPELTTLETLADAISSIEYFLESLAENWGQPDAILEVAEQSLKKIRGEAFSLDGGATGETEDKAELDSASPFPAIDDLSLVDQNVENDSANETQEIGFDTQLEIDSSSLNLDDLDSPESTTSDETKEFGFESQLEIDANSLSLDDTPEMPDDDTSVVQLNYDGTQSEEFILEPSISLEIDNKDADQESTNKDDIEGDSAQSGLELNNEADDATEMTFDSDISPPDSEGSPDPFDLMKLDNSPLTEQNESTEAGDTIAKEEQNTKVDKLADTLSLWYENSEHEEIINQLNKLLSEISEQLIISNNENALKIVNDMEGIIKCVVTGEESLNDDLINTLNWAKDTLVDLTSKDELPDVVAQSVSEEFQIDEFSLPGDVSVDFSPIEEISDTSNEKLVEDLAEVKTEEPEKTGRTFLADIDEEIIEIFMEEAQEEFDNIIRLLSVWKENTSDEESLKDMRRSFHTLKGSGRLVGALELGEFAWSFENMLNHVIDGAIETSPELFDALDQAVTAFPVLFDQISTGEKLDHHILQLMEIAETLSLGKPIDKNMFGAQNMDPKKSENTDNFTSEEFQINQTDSQDEITSSENVIDINVADALDADTADTQEIQNTFDGDESTINDEQTQEISDFDLNELELSSDIVDVDPVNSIDELAEQNQKLIDSQEIELPEINSLNNTDDLISPDTEIPDNLYTIDEITIDNDSDTVVDPVLMDIYKNEAKTHIESLHQYIYGWKNENSRKSSSELVRALHTLKGSSRTANLIPLAETCAGFEKVAKFLEDNALDLNPDTLATLEENLAYAEIVVATVDDATAIIPDNEQLLNKIHEIYDHLIHSKDTDSDTESNLITPDLTPRDSGFEQQPVVSHDYDEELLEIFLEEGIEILDDSDHCIHDWIGDVDNPKHIEALQRYLHTLKGGARMAGITEIGNLSHSIESLLTAIVNGDLNANDDVFKILQKSHDQLVKMLEQIASRQALDTGELLLKQVDALLAGEPILDVAIEEEFDELPTEENIAPEVESYTDVEAVAESNVEEPEDTNVIEDEPEEEFDESQLAGKISESLYENLSTTSDIVEFDSNVVSIDANGLPVEKAPVVADISPANKKDIASRRSGGEQVRVRAYLLDSLVNFAGEVSIYRSRMEQQVNTFRYNLVEFDDTVLRLRSQLRQFEIETETQMQSRYQNETGKTHADFDPLEFDRFTQMQQLSRGMLESLNDLDSLRGILSNLTRESETLLVQQSRVNTELQEGLMRTRMVPFSGQVSRLRRIVRQTSEELNKQVELKLSGVENEIDRTVLERILAPLEHMLRNAIAHGIEQPEERTEKGKDVKGVIELIVDRDGSDLIITVSDDGEGLNLEAIRDKAIELGKIEQDTVLPDKALFDMILEPGFSTAGDVTQISGRGVGMDVVNSEVQQLGGVFHIESVAEQGSKFSIRLPLTLSITRALMVNIADETYALPLLSVQGIERIPANDVEKLFANKDASYNWVGEEYKLIHLASEMGLAKAEITTEDKMMPLLLVRSGEYRAAIVVDHLIGSREIVVKNIGPELSVLRGISGATIMGDGSVVLILDLSVLIQLTMSVDYTADISAVIEDDSDKAVNVMVVDDSITVRKVTTRFLERNDMNVTTAKDGVDALAQLLDFIPDIMLLDVEMPRMDGFELANNMRTDDRLKNIPIIMITSRTGDKHRDRAMELGVNAYIGKPYQEIELLENILKLTKE